jgi:hypothetical protein
MRRILLAAMLTAGLAAADDDSRDVLVVTSTNGTSNQVVVFKVSTGATNSLPVVSMLPTGGAGGASGNSGALQFRNDFGAVANFGSNSVTQLVRNGGSVRIGATINTAQGCGKPDSVALSDRKLYVVGATCAEAHDWPSGRQDGPVIALPDTSAGQIVVGQTWAAVTLKSGSVLQLPLGDRGAFVGTSATVALPAGANDTPLGADFWGDLLGFNPAHSSNSFALVDKDRNVFLVAGPQPPFPTNAPCWLAKGPGSIWYSANSPGQAISIFFSDARGGVFYKSVPLPGTPTDITVSADGKWLGVIYTAADGSGGRVAVYAIDGFGDLSLVATSSPIGVPGFNGVAFSQ